MIGCFNCPITGVRLQVFDYRCPITGIRLQLYRVISEIKAGDVPITFEEIVVVIIDCSSRYLMVKSYILWQGASRNFGSVITGRRETLCLVQEHCTMTSLGLKLSSPDSGSSTVTFGSLRQVVLYIDFNDFGSWQISPNLVIILRKNWLWAVGLC